MLKALLIRVNYCPTFRPSHQTHRQTMFQRRQVNDSCTGAPHYPVTKRRIATTVLLLALTANIRCANRSIPERPAPQEDNPAVRIRVAVGDDQHIKTLHLEEYVRGSVQTEMPDPTVASHLAQLQSILARTYALSNRGRHKQEGFDLCSTTHCQVYRAQASELSRIDQLVATAVDHTAGLIITDGRGPIQAFFHADCGGRTSSATAVWGGPAPPYLSGVPDRFCVVTPRDNWSLDIKRDQLRQILNRNPDTHVGRRLDKVSIVRRDAAGRAVEVALSGSNQKIIRGERLRRVVSGQLGALSFRSTSFTVKSQADRFRFEGQGFGHGVGLCQLGAIARVHLGHSIEVILAHYYPGTWLAPHSG